MLPCLLLGCLVSSTLWPATVLADSPPAKLNPPANAKSIWIERDASTRSSHSARRSNRPVGEATVQRTQSGAILKWRAKRPATQRRAVRPAVAVFEPESDRRAVRQAAELAPVDPFRDPFGDSIAQVDDGGSFQLDPPKTQPAPENQNPPKPPGAGSSEQPTPVPAPPTRLDDGQDDKSGEPESFELPGPEVPSEKLRGRDCAEEQENCRLIRETVNNYTIDKIRLNITPELDPEADTADEAEEARRERLAEMPSREWKNRRGDVVANGKVINFRNRRAVIQDADGQVTRVSFNELGRDDICFLTAWWDLPSECILSDTRRHIDEGREEWIAATYTWTASALCHKPLYFEERALERYGHTTGPLVQPFKSGAHFFLNIAFLPYKMGMYPPNECRYALGYYRPGDCAPWMVDPIPFSLRGALFQAGAAVGVAAVIP